MPCLPTGQVLERVLYPSYQLYSHEISALATASGGGAGAGAGPQAQAQAPHTVMYHLMLHMKDKLGEAWHAAEGVQLVGEDEVRWVRSGLLAALR